MPDIQWIKISTGIFDDEKINLIEELPDHDTILVIWFKLLVLAGKRNDGGLVYITRDIPYDPEKLARVMRRPLNTVKLALETFKQFGMIEIENDYILIDKWDKHQNVEGLDKIREQNRIRQQKYREKQKQITDDNVKSRYNNAAEESREEENRKEGGGKQPPDKKEIHEKTGKPINLTRYNNLVSEYGKSVVDDYVCRASDYADSKGKKYKDYAATAANWMRRDKVKPLSKGLTCPACGEKILSPNYCPACGWIKE